MELAKIYSGAGIMGIDNTAAKMILMMKNIQGVDLNEALIFGHQKNYLGQKLRRRIASEYQVPRKTLNDEYADVFLRLVGAENFQVLDISKYEGASIIQDLNLPVPTTLSGKFSAVIDIGTSEHIFNATQSIANLRNLCRVGGHVLILSPANNYLGHGFYQFSPELFFRAFDEEFGFRIESIYLIKQRLFWESWYELTDPRNLKRRGTIQTKRRCYVGAIATRVTSEAHISPPQQSDYVAAWVENKTSRLGDIYLASPRIIRSFLDLTIMAILARWRGRLKRQRFYWKHGRLLPGNKRR